MLVRLIPVFILLLFRFYDLDLRPPHHDEAVNGWFVDGILKRGYYAYDPENYHGPFFFYVLTLFNQIFGRNIDALRIPTVIFGMAASLTPFLFRSWLGKAGTWIAVIMFTISPALVFYSRYAIHETMFVLSCVVFMYYWLKIRNDNLEWANFIGLGATLGAMASLKETFVLYGAAIVIAEALIWFLDKKAPVIFNKTFWTRLAASVGIAAAFIVICYSGFFQDENGIPNFFKAFDLWSNTGSKGNGHQKPFEYWIKLMFELEWYSLLGLGLTVLSFKKKLPRELRLISFTCCFLWFIYSLVNYKTPWCVMSFYWGLMLVASYWFGRWYEGKAKGLVVAGLIGGFSLSAYQAYEVSYVNTDIDGHLYIYGQTYHDLMEPVKVIQNRLASEPEAKNKITVQVVSSFTWPLPYVLGEVKQAGYFGEKNAPAVLDAEYVIMDRQFEPMMVQRLKGNYARQEVRSRQWASPLVFYQKVAP